jgi:uracil-DNA glycosylase family 4
MGLSKPIIFVGEAFGENEAKIGKGFVGPSGIQLLKMLDEADAITLSFTDKLLLSRYYKEYDPFLIDKVWENHPELLRTNVFQQHPPANRLEFFCGPKAEGIAGYGPLLTSKYVRKEFQYELDRLGDEILSTDPNLIVCLGNAALWSLTGRTGITKLRGTTITSTHTISGYKLLCTYHPSAVLRQWELRPTTIIDLAKITKESLHAEVQRPRCEIWIEPEIKDITRFIADHIRGCPLLSVDIETSRQQITCIGFAPRRDLALVVPIHDARKASRSYWPTAELERECWGLIRSVLEDGTIPKLFQNGLYDIAFIWRTMGVAIMGAHHDTMLLSHAQQPEALKGLAYLGSIHTSHGPWKTERKAETIKRDS